MNPQTPDTPPTITPAPESHPSAPLQAFINLNHTRAVKARLAHAIGHAGQRALAVLSIVGLVFTILLFIAKLPSLGYFVAGLTVLLFLLATWTKGDLLNLKAGPGHTPDDKFSSDALALLSKNQTQTSLDVWKNLKNHWQSRFILNHFYIPDEIIEQSLSNNISLNTVYDVAQNLAAQSQSNLVDVGHLIGGLMLSSETLKNHLLTIKLNKNDIHDVIAWLDRSRSMLDEKPRDYGGIGRDWAHGYTPTLDRFGRNISLSVEGKGSHFSYLSESLAVQGVKNSFAQGANAVALIGDPGSGKTSHIYALAQNLLAEKQDRSLEHHQIFSLSASMIISSATKPGELEHTVNQILSESAHAGHVVLFFDDAELFFANDTGSFDASRILLPVIQSRAVRLIFAFTPHAWQNLKANSATLTSLISPVMLSERSEADVMRVLEDTALGLEHKNKVLITYGALREVYRLSGRFETEIAYPGKAINLLEQSLSQAENNTINEASVQRAIEQSRGVKVTSATAAESDTLLNLETLIHQRMINQSRAVSVVSNALRRARAGVANPKRPIGSFLFLGPTGVGKTELAKAISSVYFDSEARMIRLDMSEYQQAEDVARLLSSGANDSSSLIMSIRQQPFGVVLLDEIEKAHPNILNLLLQLLDEGQLTDTSGRMASFKDCVIICTSNAGADTIRERLAAGEALEAFEDQLTDQLIGSGQFKPELLNRFDEIVLFRPLTPEELLQVVALMMQEINRTLAPQNITVELTPAAMSRIVEVGYDPRLGARPMRRTLQRAVEDTVAQRILQGTITPGTHTILDLPDLQL